MLKEETKDQIPLFDLPLRETPVAPPDSNRKTSGNKPAVTEKPTRTGTQGKPVTGTAVRQKSAKPVRSARAAAAPVPEGDVRLTANIRQELHLKLKIAAATRRTTIGELIEDLVEQYL